MASMEPPPGHVINTTNAAQLNCTYSVATRRQMVEGVLSDECELVSARTARLSPKWENWPPYGRTLNPWSARLKQVSF